MAKGATRGRKKAAEKDPNAPQETKAQKFSRLATARVNTALAKIRLIANLSGPGYEYTPEQVSKIESNLNDTVSETMGRFSRKEKSAIEKVTI